MRERSKIFEIMIWQSGYSRISKFIISEILAHMVGPWQRSGIWKLGLLTVLVKERVKVVRLTQLVHLLFELRSKLAPLFLIDLR